MLRVQGIFTSTSHQSNGEFSGLLAFYYCASVKRTIRLHEDMQKSRHGGMLGSGFDTFYYRFLASFMIGLLRFSYL
jgi:hypothetical protein